MENRESEEVTPQLRDEEVNQMLRGQEEQQEQHMNENEEEEEQDSQEQRKRNKLKKFLLILTIVYVSIIVILTLIIMYNDYVRTKVLDYFNSVNSGNFEDLMILCLIGIIVILAGFPLSFYQVIFGYIIGEFWWALFLISVVKIIGFTMAFFIAKYCLKESITELLKDNDYFKSFEIMVVKRPIQMITLIKLMHIPSLVKYYGVGVLNVTLWQFFFPTVWTSPVLAAIWINVGVQLNSIYDINEEQEPTKEEQIWRWGMIGLTVLVFFYLTYLTKKAFDELREETEKMRQEQQNPEYQPLSGNEENENDEQQQQNNDNNQQI